MYSNTDYVSVNGTDSSICGSITEPCMLYYTDFDDWPQREKIKKVVRFIIYQC